MKWQQLFGEQLDNLSDWLSGRWTQLLVPLVVALTAGLLVQSPFSDETPTYRSGEIVQADVKAEAPILVVDEELTQKKKNEAASKVLPVYDYDPQALQSLSARLTEAFSMGRKSAGDYDPEKRQDIEELLGVELNSEEWNVLKSLQFSRRSQATIESLLQNVYSSKKISETKLSIEPNQVVLRDLISESEKKVKKEELEGQVMPLPEAVEQIKSRQLNEDRRFRGLSYSQFTVLKGVASKLLISNVSYNQIETSARRDEARGQVEAVVVEIEKGEMIVREGQRVERKHVLLLEGLKNSAQGRADIGSFLAFSFLIFVLIFILHWVGHRNFKRFRLSDKDRFVLGGFFVLSLLIIAVLNFLLGSGEIQLGSGLNLSLLLPFAFVGMSLRLFSSMEITTFFSLLFSVCVAWLLKDPYLGLTSFVVAIVGAAGMRHISQRMDVLRAGLIAGAIQGIALCLGALMGLTDSAGLNTDWLNYLATFGFGLASGILASAVVFVLQPLIEFVGYTTDLRLMELSNTNNPLLKELTMKAPGTYFHSFTVSQLSEKAAEAINANPLFARVASLYHDIGKLKKPQYFIENIKGENKHDKLVPSMSALIIAGHVKEGIELGLRHKLPQGIIDCIPQHHGTALISYFYEKAKKAAAEGEEVDDRDFRYPGPKPQTKEAAIIMMADAVEATAKSLKDANADQLKQSVNATIRRFFLDGQLDECELSLKDLNAIGNAFVTVLQGIYHQRIDYPHLRKKEKADKQLDETKPLAKGSQS